MAKEITSVETRLEEQLRVTVTAREHTITLDEPENLGSSDAGMTPIEALLGALGACKCIVAKSYAKKFDVQFREIRVKVEGELDVDGFLGINPEAKIGLSQVKSLYYFDSDSPREKIEALIAFVDKTCPVADTLINTPGLASELIILDQ